VAVDEPENIIPEFCQKHNIQTIYKQKEWTSEEVEETQKVRSKLNNREIVELYNQFLYHPEDILSDPQKIPNVFTNFRKKVEKYVAVRSETTIVQNFEKENLIAHEYHIPTLTDLGFEPQKQDSRTAFPFSGGETSALERLNDYFFNTKKLGFYKKTRNGLVGIDYSSKFSPWLANGSISAKTIYWQVKKFEQEHYKNQSTYWLIFELIWRDYFKYVSIKHGNDIFKIGGILQKEYEWSRDETLIQQWINGETEDDFVNANMIELKETGWMSNRGRQNVASYFAKELELDWRIGAAYFEEQLLDYDVHSNYGNWMYVSGVGNDPRDRKFNTQTQAERYDGNHAFRKLWLQKTLFS
jgi:deoxyribodipyrimidine photo-lyase